MPDLTDYQVYEKHLSKLKKGIPLWQPEPTELGEILLGDVGVMREGGFYRLFNVLRDRDDPANEEVPENFESLQLQKKLFHVRENAIPAGPLYSKTMQSLDLEAESTSSLAGAKIKFQCKHDQGAVLILDHKAREESVLVGRHAVEYIKQHYKSWDDFSQTEKGFDLLQGNHVIFVSGFVKTASSWSMAAITRNGKSATLGFNAGVGTLPTFSVEVKGEKKVATSIAQRKWPDDDNKPNDSSPDLTFDHCVFLKYHKARYSRWRGIVVKGNADPQDLPSADQREDEDNAGEDLGTSDGSEVDGEETPSVLKSDDPLDYVLDYILEESNAEFAIASVAGLYAACPDDVPDDIEQFLRETKPAVYVTDSGIGLLLCEPEMLEALMAEDEAPAAIGEHTATEGDADAGADADADADAEVDAEAEQLPPYVEESSSDHPFQKSTLDPPPPPGPSADAPDDGGENASDKRLAVEVEPFGAQVTLYNILAFSANDMYLAGGGIDGSITAWELGTGARVIKCVPEGNGTIFTKWESRSRQSSAAGPPPLSTVNSIEFSPIPEVPAFVCGTDSGMAVWWNVATKVWKIIGENTHTSAVRNVKWSPNGKLIATMCMDSKIHFWDSTTLELVRTIEGGNNSSSHPLAFSPDGSKLATADSLFCVNIWNVQSGEKAGCLSGHEGVIWTLAFEPSGERLITGSDDGTARIWKVEANAELISLGEMFGPVWHAEFSKDGKHVCIGQTDGAVVFFDSFTGSKVCTIEGGSSEEMSTACQPHATLSPDGSTLIVASGPRVLRCNTSTGETLGKVEQMDNICGMQFSHDGHRVASAAEDGLTRVWDLSMFDNEQGEGILSLDD